jgi:nucleoside-diphosphate-sugar epimerase
MSVFVIGATGSIGSAIVKELMGAGHQMFGLTRSDGGRQVACRRWLRYIEVIQLPGGHAATAKAVASPERTKQMNSRTRNGESK